MCNVPTNVHPKKLKVEANKHDKQTANSVEGDLHLEFDELSLFVLVLGLFCLSMFEQFPIPVVALSIWSTHAKHDMIKLNTHIYVYIMIYSNY